jgi:hypothetical protein
MQKIKLAKRSEHVYVKELKNRSEVKCFMFELNNIEAKRTGSIVILYLKSQKSELSFFLKGKAKNESVL